MPRPDWLPAAAWPFESFAVESGDAQLAVTDIGEGPVLLFVHVGAWSFIWRDLIARLSRDFRCITFDAPGNGRSKGPRRSPVTLEGASQAVTAVIEALRLDDFTPVLHDLGGPAGLAAIACVPERVRGIVAMNAFGWTPVEPGLRFMLALMGSRVVREFNVFTRLIPRVSATSFGVGRNMDESSRQAFLAGMGPRGIRAFHNYMRSARNSDALYHRVAEALRGDLSHLPLLTIFGERNDPFGFQQRWRELFPSARQVVVAKGNHFPMCDAPDFVARTIREWFPKTEVPETKNERLKSA
jgi:haloalkane dehalogenase